VILHDKRRLKAEWVRSDPQTDLAVVKVDPDRLIEAPVGDSDRMHVGDWVLAIGAPEGLPQTVTAGIISAKGRTTYKPGRYENYLQTDAAINHGNSGGPLVNMKGEVIGINTAIISRTGVNEGIGLSIPSNLARHIMEQLIDNGEVVRGYLGVRIQNIDERLAESFRLPHTRGALVSQVAKGSPAEKGGLKDGDFIVSVNDKPVRNVNDLRNQVAMLRPEKQYPFVLFRDGKRMTLPVAVGKQPKDMVAAFGGVPETAAGVYENERYGLTVRNVTQELLKKYRYGETVRGVVITRVEEGSDAARQGLTEGMIITHAHGKAVTSIEELGEAMSSDQAAKGIRLRVTDAQDAQRFVFILPKDKK